MTMLTITYLQAGHLSQKRTMTFLVDKDSPIDVSEHLHPTAVITKIEMPA